MSSGAGMKHDGAKNSKHNKYVAKYGATVRMTSYALGYCSIEFSANAMVVKYYDADAKMFYNRTLPRRRNLDASANTMTPSPTSITKATQTIDVPEHLS
jgi:hypothetical protein